jgi:hypothetical protein
MKLAMKGIAVSVILICGCERQLPVADNQPISGYQIQGKVTDRIGNPIPNVSVLLDYNASIVYLDTIITRRYFVTDTSAPIQAVAANLENRIIMVITHPQKVFGWFQATWNGNDSTGNTAPSGIYHIQYIMNGQVVYSYDQLISGGQVAVTDVFGRYTIPGRFLPIDSSSVPYFSSYDSSYVGNLHISDDVVLTFVYPPRFRQVEQVLNEGLVTFIDVEFN